MKKRKLLTSLLCATAAFSLLGTMTSCNDKTNDDPAGETQQFTITFNSNGGSSIAKVQVEENGKVKEPSAPTKSGYIFVGWYTDEALTQKYSFDSPVTGNLTLYAKWEAEVSYTATLVNNNGTQNSTIQSTKSNGKYYFTEPTDVPTKQYMKFEGWYTDEALTQKYDFNTEVTANITLYAKYVQGYDEVTSELDFVGFASTIKPNPSGNVSLTEKTQFGKFTIEAGSRFEIDTANPDKNNVNTQGKLFYFTLSGAGNSNAFTLNYKWASSNDGSVEILNANNEVVWKKELCKNGDPAEDVEVSDLPAGTYTISATKSIRIYNLVLAERLPQGPTNGIELNTASVTRNFLLGRDFSSEGLEVLLTYENGRKDVLDSDKFTITHDDFSTAGIKTVTVSYVLDQETTYTKTYTVNVCQATELVVYNYVLDSKRVTLNAQEIYFVGSTFKFDNLVIKAKCELPKENNTDPTKYIEFLLNSDEYTATAADLTTKGNKSATFTFGSGSSALTANYNVEVVDSVDLSKATSIFIFVDPTLPIGVNTVQNTECYNLHTINQALQFIKLSGASDNTIKAVALKEGAVYKEKIEITIPNLTIGTISSNENVNNAKITFDAYNALLEPSETITHSTDGSASLTIRPDAENFTAMNVTFDNYYNTYELYSQLVPIAGTNNSQGVAVLNQGDKSMFYQCSFYGYQDTLYAQVGRQYYYDCLIQGHTDYIFGYDATAYFESCKINTIGAGVENNNGGYIVAAKGNLKDDKNINYGYIFNNCEFTANENTMVGSVSLARGWDKGMTMMVMNSTISGHYSKEAYGDATSTKNDRYGKMNAEPNEKFLLEYNNTGDGAISQSLAKTCTVVDAIAALPYTMLTTVFGWNNGTTTYNDNWAGIIQSNVSVSLYNGSTCIKTINEWSGNKLLETLCEAPKLEGKKFVAWYTDSALTQKYDFESNLTAGELKLYAKYIDATTIIEEYSAKDLTAGTDYKGQTLFDGELLTLKVASGTVKADNTADYNNGAMQLKLDKDIDGETVLDKALLFTAKANCTVVLSLCSSGTAKGWVLTEGTTEVQTGSVDKNSGAITTVTLTLEAGKTYRLSAPKGGIRFESLVAEGGNTVAEIEEKYSAKDLTAGTDYKGQTLFDGELLTLKVASGTVKADNTADYNNGAMQLKLDKDIDGETVLDKALLLTAKANCTVVLSLCSSGTAKGWVLTEGTTEVQTGSVDKNSGAITTVTLTLEAGKTYRLSAPKGGIRFESLVATGKPATTIKEEYSTKDLTAGTDYKDQTLFDGELLTLKVASGTVKADNTADYNNGAMQLKLDKDIDGETVLDKALLLTAKANCTVVLSLCASGTAKGWVLTEGTTEVQTGSVDKNSGAITTVTLTLEAGKTYRLSAPNGGIRFESLVATSK